MRTSDTPTAPYIPSAKHRLIENGHIVLWLIKDTCWVNEWKAGGLTMIAPTLGVAIYILWRSRRNRSELFHNLAICLWISANSLWMAGEFFKHELRPYAFMLFITGLIILGIYYLFFFRKDQAAQAPAASAVTEHLESHDRGN